MAVGGRNAVARRHDRRHMTSDNAMSGQIENQTRRLQMLPHCPSYDQLLERKMGPNTSADAVVWTVKSCTLVRSINESGIPARRTCFQANSIVSIVAMFALVLLLRRQAKKCPAAN